MAKYSTGGISSDDDGSCELCGAEGTTLQTERVAGATLAVCPDCRSRHGASNAPTDRDEQGRPTDSRDPDESNRKRRAAQNQARLDDAQRTNPETWVDGAEYEGDPLPYLVRGYGDRVANARAAVDFGTADLANELDVSEQKIIAIEAGRATDAGVGGSLIEAIESTLDISLTEEH